MFLGTDVQSLAFKTVLILRDLALQTARAFVGGSVNAFTCGSSTA